LTFRNSVITDNFDCIETMPDRW